jgi:hypothetical protein
MLLHLFSSLPSAGEASRGYLHGGILIDFVGQRAPSSRLGLLMLDLVVLAVQCFMLAVHVERERLRKILLPSRHLQTGGEITGSEIPGSAMTHHPEQDHDSEERGVLRNVQNFADGTNDIEMQSMNHSERITEGERDESGRLLPDDSTQASSSADLGDVLRSGNAILADLYVVEAIRTAGNDYRSAAAHSLQTLGYAATIARLTAERRARLDARIRQR